MSEALTTTGIKGLMGRDEVKKRFGEILGKKAQGFVSSVINVTNNNKLLNNANPQTVLSAAIVAASLDLPIDPNLGFAYIVPFKGQAQCQIGYRGFIQLALRTGQYTRMNIVPVYENQFKGFNALTEELDANFNESGSGDIKGFVFYFKMINGFEKTVFEFKEKLLEHGKRYSQTFNNGPWKTHTDEMCMKTLIKQTLKRWGILSIEMQNAMTFDQAVVNNDDLNNADIEYPDAIETDYEVQKSSLEEELENESKE